MEVNELEDAKTLKAVMFLMIQEHVRSIPNDQELGKEIRNGSGDHPCYITYDIDSLDPAYAPGTGTPEICGLTPKT